MRTDDDDDNGRRSMGILSPCEPEGSLEVIKQNTKWVVRLLIFRGFMKIFTCLFLDLLFSLCLP